MERVRVELAERGYDVVITRDLLGDLASVVELPAGARRAVVVTQPPIRTYAQAVADGLARAGLLVEVVEVPDGEGAKDLDRVAALYARFAQLGLARTDLVVAVGGGVVGDLAGFAAATWHRGTNLLQVPTTLVAQVDAAIGGKTGVNLSFGKNLVGSYHQPVAVVADVAVLATLSRRDLVAGLGEVVKYGLIGDPDLLTLLEAHVGDVSDPGLLAQLVSRCARVKAAVVAADERESGVRAHLNLGHTYGHALEAATGFTPFRHGEAVAVGTCVALRVGVHLGRTAPALVERTESLLAALDLPRRAPRLPREDLWAYMGRDKKARAGVRFVIVDGPGEPAVVEPPVAVVDSAISEVEEAA